MKKKQKWMVEPYRLDAYGGYNIRIAYNDPGAIIERGYDPGEHDYSEDDDHEDERKIIMTEDKFKKAVAGLLDTVKSCIEEGRLVNAGDNDIMPIVWGSMEEVEQYL
jgi:hypothetical protein